MVIALALASTDAVAARIRMQVESPAGTVFYVYLARPVGLAPVRPIVIAIPDAGAAAEAQLDDWYPLAETYQILVAVPDLSPPAAADATVLDAIFERISRRFDMIAERYSVYGHAVGAHHLQEWLLERPQPRVDRVVLAAADRYVLPDPGPSPSGGQAAVATAPEQMRRYLQLPLTVLVGEKDRATEVSAVELALGDPQVGAQRIAKAEAFLEAGGSAAGRLDVPFGWRLVTVPGASRDNRELACAAVLYLLGEM